MKPSHLYLFKFSFFYGFLDLGKLDAEASLALSGTIVKVQCSESTLHRSRFVGVKGHLVLNAELFGCHQYLNETSRLFVN